MTPEESPPYKASGLGCFTLFLLPFAAVGLFMSYLLVSTILEAQRTRSWSRVPAHIEDATLEIKRGRNSRTYLAKARYSYEVDGRRFTGERVSLHGGADNVGSFQKDVYKTLLHHKHSGDPYLAYVDPDNPENAVLFAELRLGLVLLYAAFAATFGGAGFGLLFGLWASNSREKKRQALAAKYPGQPWMHRSDWRESKVRTPAATNAMIFSVVALVTTGLTAPVLFLVPDEVGKGNYGALIALVFPLIGAAILWFSIRSLIIWRRFGSATLELHTLPVEPGRDLRGTIRLPSGLSADSAHPVELELRCEKIITTGNPGRRRVSRNLVWQEKRTVRSTGAGGVAGGTIPVDISVPEHLPPTGDESDPRCIVWHLTAKAEIPGVNFHADFQLPVFRRGSGFR